MCGRFSQKATAKSLAEHFGLDLGEIVFEKSRFNIAPSQKVPCIRRLEKNSCALLKWGLIPSWAKDPAIAYKLINARAETVHEKPAFRNAFKKRRCLVPASGFYEWKKEGERKKPFYFHLRDENLFSFAGLWEEWVVPQGEVVETFTILTTQANALLAPIHNRMPVIIDPANYDEWLDPKRSDVKDLSHFWIPYEAEKMAFHEVSPRVNNPRNEGEDLLETLAAP